MQISYCLLLPYFSVCFLYFFHFAASDTNYDSFAHCLAKYSLPNDQITQILYSRTNLSYTPILNAHIRNLRFNTSSSPKPVIIVTPFTVKQVQATALCTKSLGLQLKIRSGGHDFEGISYVSSSGMDFVILDMFNLRSISVDIKNESAWVQSGATLGELYYRIWEKSRLHAFPAGICPTVGIGGHISGGGYGAMLRRFGLAVDNLLDAQIVDAKGRVLDRASMGEDLFWAISGGGGASFCVVLGYKIKLVRVPEVVTVFRVETSMEQNGTDVVYRWQEVADKIDNDLFIRLLLQPSKVKKVKGWQMTVRPTFLGMFLGDSKRLISVTNGQFPELGLKKDDCLEMGFAESVLWWSNFNKGTAMETLLNRTPNSLNFGKKKSDYVVKPIPKDGLESIFKKLTQMGRIGFLFNPYGGRMKEIPEGEKPFAHRAGVIYKIQYSVAWGEDDPASSKKYIAQARELYNFMTPFVSKDPRRSFLNYRDLDIGTTSNGKDSYTEGKVFGHKYFNGNFDRLVRVKTIFDPENFFRNEQSIPTLVRGKESNTNPFLKSL